MYSPQLYRKACPPFGPCHPVSPEAVPCHPVLLVLPRHFSPATGSQIAAAPSGPFQDWSAIWYAVPAHAEHDAQVLQI